MNHSYYTNGVTEEIVGHEHTDADEAYFSKRTIVTRRPAGAHATQITVVVVTAKKMVITRQSTRALTVSSRMSRGMSGVNSATIDHTPRAMVPNVASCRIVNTFLVAENNKIKMTGECDLSQVIFHRQRVSKNPLICS